MKKNYLLCILLLSLISYSQNFDSFASGIKINNTTYNLTGSSPNEINPGGPVYNGTNLGNFKQNSTCANITAGEIKTFKQASSNVCSATLKWRVYPAGSPAGSFSAIPLLPVFECNLVTNIFNDGFGSCVANDQKWKDYTLNTSFVNSLSPGNYTLEIFYEFTGSNTSTVTCETTKYINNSGTNYKASFTILSPTLTCPANITANVGAGSCTASVITPNPIIDDNCSVAKLTWALTGATTGNSIASGINNLGTQIFNLGTTTVTYTVTDASNNSVTCSYTVTVSDTIVPTISCPANITANVGAGTCTASVITPNPTTADNCSVTKLTWALTGATTATSAVSGINNLGTRVFNLGTTTVTYTVSDAANNNANCSYTVIVSDNVNPSITAPAAVNTTTNAACTATSVVLGTPVTADNCSVASVSNNAPVWFPLGNTTVIWTVTDGAGLTATANQTVTVTDNIVPTISCPANITANVGAGTCTASVITPNPTTADNCSVTKLTWALTGATTATSAVSGINNLGTRVFNLGTTTVTYIVSDAVNNSTNCSYTVIVSDNIVPTISCPANITANVGAGSCTASVITPNPTTADNCSVTKLTWALTGATTATSAVSGINNLGTRVFNLGTTTVTYTVSDAANNNVNCSFTVIVSDNIVPTISCPANITANVGAGTCTASVITPNPTTTDNCSVTKLTWALTGATVASSAVSGINNLGTQIFNLGTTTVTYTVSDAANNNVNCSFTVIVSDNIVPTISCPANMTATVGAGTCTASVITTNPTTADNCSVTKLTWTLTGATTASSAVSGINSLGTRVFNLGTTTITYTLTDAANNSVSCSYTVIVSDTIIPTITCSANMTANVGAGSCAASVITSNPTTADNCSVTKLTWALTGATTATSAVTGINNLGTRIFNLGTTTVTYTVSDAANNSVNCSFTVIVSDNIVPTISCPANITANVGAGTCTASVITPNPTTADNCSVTKLTWALTGATSATSAITGINNLGTRIFNLGTTTVTYTVSDAANNSITCFFTVIVSDNINPTITAPANVNTTTNTSCTATGLVIGTPVTGDNCTVVTVTNNHPSTTYPIGNTTVIWTVKDGAGLTATANQTVTVVDNVVPTISCPYNVIVNTSSDGTGNCSTIAAIGTPTTSDNCSVSSIIAKVNGTTINPVTYIFPKGNTFVDWIVTDSSGNTSTCRQTVTVLDNEKPIAPSMPVITAQCSITVPYPIATDNCDGSVTATTNDNRTFNSQVGGSITWSFKDSSNNETIVTQNVVILDTTVPVKNVSSLPALSFSGCQIVATEITPPTATDNCKGIINGTPDIIFPYTTQGARTITWTYNDGNGNTATQTQSLTLTAPIITEGTLLGCLSDTYTYNAATAKDNIAITSCPDDINPITLRLSGQVGTIVQWERFEAGNTNWTVIPGTSGTINYNTTFNYQTTKSTLFRVLIQVGTCTKYTNMVNIHAVPPDVPPILQEDNFVICLNDPVTLMAHNGYTSTVNVDDGGDFNTGQFPDKWDPTQWKIDGQTAGAQWTAAGNNTKFNNWSGTNNHPVGTLYRIEYDSNDFKFGIAHGNYNSPAYIAAFPPGNATTLETPVFSLVGLGTASIDFDQAYNLHAGDVAKLELSLDGGATYTVTLQNLIGTSPRALTWGNTHGAPVPYPYLAPKPNNSTTTYYNFQNDNSSFDISDYIGNDKVRVRWTFFGTTDESAWAIDNITIPVRPYSDQLEWTDGIGDSNTPPLASGTIDVAYTFTPISPGVHHYGATSIINSCRTYDPSGTAIATVKVNYSYAGADISPASGKCGGTRASLNAYDNTHTATWNKTNGSYTRTLDDFSDDEGTGTIGTWSVVSSTGSCGSGSFSNTVDPKATFTGAAGTYILRWTVATCTDDVQVTLENCNVVDFDGEDDFVNFNNNYNLSTSFTISVWVKPETQPVSGTAIQTIFSKRNGDNLNETNGYDLRLDSNNFISFNWNNGATLKSSHPISTARWYHIGVTYNGSIYKLYIDGLEVATAAGSAPITNNYNSILGAMYKSGNENVSKNYYSGWLEELRIWNVALNPDQLHQMMNQVIDANGAQVRGAIIPIDVNGLTWSNLIGYYRMDNLSCGYLKPYGGRGVDGRLLNINTGQSKTAPIPYTTVRNGNWKDRGASTTPWLYGNSVWDYPNSTGINGQAIDWNIVVESHNLNSDDKDITLLGLIINTGTKLNVVAPGVENETNSGHMLWLTHYLKLNGFIDLVGESQLIQKRYYPYPDQYSESIIDETSSGYIERDQKGRKNSFNYNYWCSPVSTMGGPNNSPYTISSVLKDGTDSANPKIINFGDGPFFADTALTNPIKISNRWLWTYGSTTPDSNSDLDNYYQWKYVGSTGLIRAGEGFTMKGTGGTAAINATQNHVFVGKPNSGDIQTSYLGVDETYLIGNPYPCALDADEFIKNNLSSASCSGCTGTANVFNGVLYFWDHFGQSDNHNLAEYEGGYATYSLLGGVRARSFDDPLTASTGGFGTNVPKRYVPVGQGFFVDATLDLEINGSVTTATTPGYLYFKNGQRAFKRETSGSSTFMKTAGSKNSKTVETVETDTRSKIRLGFDSFNGAHRQLLVGADENTTNNFDIGYDAPMYDTDVNDMFWEINKSQFVIQAVSDFNINRIIPLGVIVANEGEVTIKIDALENISSTTEIYLYDILTAKYHNLREGAFKISLPVGEYNNRFSMRFTSKTLDEQTDINQGVNVFYYNKNKVLVIKNNIINSLINEVSLFNIQGQNIEKWEIENKQQAKIEIPIKNLPADIYIAKVKTSKGDLSKKIIVN